MKQLLLDIVNSIVDNPDKVKLDESTDAEGNINYTLTVDPSDMGKIIGKEGKVIKSIRNIIRIPAIKQNKKVNLELTEQERIEKEGEEASTEDTGTESQTTAESEAPVVEAESNETPKDEETDSEDK